MSFFKHVQLHEYDITDKGITKACYDEMKADGYDIVITEKEMQVLAAHRCEEFKNYMRPLFAQVLTMTPQEYKAHCAKDTIKIGSDLDDLPWDDYEGNLLNYFCGMTPQESKEFNRRTK